jgi:hypothetical protein
MRFRLPTCTAVLLFLLSGIAFGAGEAQRADTKTALAGLESWLGPGPNGEQWRQYLDLKALGEQIDNPTDVEVLEATLARLQSDAPGLDLPRFIQLRDALSAWIDAVSVPTPAAAIEAVKKAATEFHPPTAADLAAAKTRLDTDLTSLDQYLARLGKVGTGWRVYLALDELRKELAAGPAPVAPSGQENADAGDAAAPADEAADSHLATLKNIHSRFVADTPGLEIPQFLTAGDALENYIELAEVVEPAAADGKGKPKLEEQHTANLADLAKMLGAYQSKPTEQLAANIDNQLAWLWRRHLDRDLVTLVRRSYGQPNLYVAIDKGLIATGVERSIDERNAPLTDNILGTQINGRATTVGQVKLELVPSPNRAMFDVLLSGTVSTNTVGQNGPATIHASGTTKIAGRKRVSVDALGVHSVPATAAAVTSTRINSVQVSGLGQGVAEQRVAEGKGQAERIGAQHAEARIKARLDKEMDANLTKANQNFATKFRNPLIRARKFPALLELSTTPARIQLEMLEATASQLATATEPPQLESWEKSYPLVAVVHQSAVNNGAADFLSGVTLTDDQVRQKIIDLNNGTLPERLAKDQDQEPWSIRFARSRPISFDVRPGGLSITVRGRAFTTGEGGAKKHGAMNITAVYKIEPSDAGPQLTRQGDLEIVPPDFDPQKSKLSMGQVSLRTVLQKKFRKIFPQQIQPEPVVLGGQWKDAGQLVLDQLQVADGWVSVAYRWVPKAAGAKTVAGRN